MSKYKIFIDELTPLLSNNSEGMTTTEIAGLLNMERSSCSKYLNRLYNEGFLQKSNSRPVKYYLPEASPSNSISLDGDFSDLIGYDRSLSLSIDKAKASIVYPPNGLHSLILGDTGVGKSLFAEKMVDFAINNSIVKKDAPFISFNCADYSDNPALLTAQIFGVVKGAFTGADSNKPGLLKLAHGGFLFLDEVHRLPPTGQEMLFTYIDKGYFRPLGETRNNEHVNVRIICATTERPSSYLLSTFMRRIPMIIELPSLSNRSIEERFSLLEFFFKKESSILGKAITLSSNSIISFLLYDCPNNIGQLKSDVQLSCAKSFLKYTGSMREDVFISRGEIPNHVRQGLLKLPENRNRVERIIGSIDSIVFDGTSSDKITLSNEFNMDNYDFYSNMEQEVTRLKELGLSALEIDNILNSNIESSFKKYISHIDDRISSDNIMDIISPEVRSLVDEIFDMATIHFNRTFPKKIYYTLCFHLERSIERIRNHEKIYNPRLNYIRVRHEESFLFSMKVANLMDQRFNILTPVDEIGYIAMFFPDEIDDDSKEDKTLVKVVVLMHGNSTASSMVDVVNTLIEDADAIGIDMPLSLKPMDFYKIVRDKVVEINEGKGVILLVDMGSLTNFSNMIEEETGIPVGSIDMVTTITAMDISRRAMMGARLDELMSTKKPSASSIFKSTPKQPAIICGCFTGDGSSKKIVEISSVAADSNGIKVIPLQILDRNQFFKDLESLENQYEIILVATATGMEIPGITSIVLADFLSNMDAILQIYQQDLEIIKRISDTLYTTMKNMDISLVLKNGLYMIHSYQYRYNMDIGEDIRLGFLMHLVFLVSEKLINPNNIVESAKFDDDKTGYIRKLSTSLANSLSITFTTDDLTTFKAILEQKR